VLPVIKKNPSPSGNTLSNHSSTGNDPSPRGKPTLPPTGNKEDLIKQKTKKEDGAPEVDLQGSPPAHEKVYENIYQGATQTPGATPPPQKKEEDYSFEKKPNLKGAAIFHAMAKRGISDKGESADSNPGYKLNCMSCGFLTEFENRDAAAEGKCKKCGKLIFEEAKAE